MQLALTVIIASRLSAERKRGQQQHPHRLETQHLWTFGQ